MADKRSTAMLGNTNAKKGKKNAFQRAAQTFKDKTGMTAANVLRESIGDNRRDLFEVKKESAKAAKAMASIPGQRVDNRKGANAFSRMEHAQLAQNKRSRGAEIYAAKQKIVRDPLTTFVEWGTDSIYGIHGHKTPREAAKDYTDSESAKKRPIRKYKKPAAKKSK